jgi:hypothetical protein
MSLFGAVLRPEPFGVRVDGAVYRYDAMAAQPWLLALSSDLWITGVFPRLLADDQQYEHAMDAIQDGDIDTDDINRAAFDAIGQAGGRQWWHTYNLVRAANGDVSGALLGRLVMAGVDAERVSLAGWCSALYAILAKGQDVKGMAKLDAFVATPPAIAGAFEDAAGDSFAAMVAAARMG